MKGRERHCFLGHPLKCSHSVLRPPVEPAAQCRPWNFCASLAVQLCNRLIRDGATLVQNAADVIEVICPFGSIARVASPVIPFEPAATDAGSDERAIIEELLGPSAVPIDEIVRLSGMPSGAVQLVLLALDLGGRLDRNAEGRVSLSRAKPALDEAKSSPSPSRVYMREENIT